MTDAEIREQAERYIDAAIARGGGGVDTQQREAAIKKMEAATRLLLSLADRA
jgi:hypothetical protein